MHESDSTFDSATEFPCHFSMKQACMCITIVLLFYQLGFFGRGTLRCCLRGIADGYRPVTANGGSHGTARPFHGLGKLVWMHIPWAYGVFTQADAGNSWIRYSSPRCCSALALHALSPGDGCKQHPHSTRFLPGHAANLGIGMARPWPSPVPAVARGQARHTALGACMHYGNRTLF